MDLPSVSLKDNEQQIVNNNHLWWLASQSSFPLPPSAFRTSTEQALNIPLGGLPPEVLESYHQWLANYHLLFDFDLNAPVFSQYPSIPTDGEPQPYPNLDPLASSISEVDDNTAFKLFDQSQTLDQLSPLDLSLTDTQTLVESSTESSPSSPTRHDSPQSEDSPTPETYNRRRRRKSSISTSPKSRKSSFSGNSSQNSSHLDRIRERNRISAQRFRDKKKADAIDLEMRTHKLSEQRDHLVREITDLQWQSILLQEQCLRQTMCDCKDVKGFFKNKTNLHEKLCQTELKCHT